MFKFKRLKVVGYFTATVDIPTEMLEEDFPVQDLYDYLDQTLSETVESGNITFNSDDFYEV